MFQQRGFHPDKQVWRESKCNARGLPWVKALWREWRTKCFCICVNIGTYHSTKNFKIFEKGTNGTEISWEKFQKTQKLLNLRKANHSTENSGMNVKWNGNFQEKNFRKFGYTSRGCPLFGNLCKFPIFYSALASSFGCDHSELDISCKDDAHSIKETL